MKRIHVTTGSSVRGEEEGGRKEEGALWAVKWRLSEWEIQLQRLQPRSPAVEAPLPFFLGPRLTRPVRHRLRGPSRAAAPARPFPAGSPLARLRSGPPSASLLPLPLPSPSLPSP